MSIYMTRGVFDQAKMIHRDKENRRKNYNNHVENTPCLDHNFPVLRGLVSLAKKMASDCYSYEKSSKEITRDFLIGIENLREDL